MDVRKKYITQLVKDLEEIWVDTDPVLVIENIVVLLS